MSSENIEVVQKSLAAFEGNADIWAETLDPSFEWYPLEEGNMPSRGFESASRVRERWLEGWDEHRVEVEEILDGGDSVVSTVHLRGTGKGSGVEVDLRIYMHWRLREGKLVYLYEYDDRAEALRAAGIAD
jgi:ketosteroid isomerase-like protein